MVLASCAAEGHRPGFLCLAKAGRCFVYFPACLISIDNTDRHRSNNLRVDADKSR